MPPAPRYDRYSRVKVEIRRGAKTPFPNAQAGGDRRPDGDDDGEVARMRARPRLEPALLASGRKIGGPPCALVESRSRSV